MFQRLTSEVADLLSSNYDVSGTDVATPTAAMLVKQILC
jgi:hypothetical protein